ncbi:hypothetical protein E2542_SST26392 [Spatholobus suberectus]|nr:hypothetical protein E2542_SST26392 [Spatholobus suberectus]
MVPLCLLIAKNSLLAMAGLCALLCLFEVVDVVNERENRDIVRSWALDFNVNPEDGNHIVEVHEIGGFDVMDTRPSGDRILLGGGYSNNFVHSESSQSLDGKEKTSKFVLDLNISLWLESATPEVGFVSICWERR